MLKNKTAVVTGGSRGIGYAIVKKYLENGANVALLGSRKETVEKAVAQLKEENPDYPVIGLWPDLNDLESMTQAFQEVKDVFGSVDILANNAGVSSSTSLYDYKPGEFEKVMNLNVNAVYICSKAVAPFMKEQGGGAIINTSSMVSLYGQPSGSAYPASKFAVNGLTKSLARELGKDKIRVNAVAPGIINTDMVAALPESMIAPLVARVPLGRIGQPEDIANAYLFLGSDLASYVTGEILSVDGAAMT